MCFFPYYFTCLPCQEDEIKKKYNTSTTTASSSSSVSCYSCYLQEEKISSLDAKQKWCKIKCANIIKRGEERCWLGLMMAWQRDLIHVWPIIMPECVLLSSDALQLFQGSAKIA